MSRQGNLARGLRAIALAATLLAGCEPPPGGGSSGSSLPPPSDGLGSISVELHLGSSIRLASVGYVITGSGFSRTGSLDVSNSTTVSGVIGGLPVGTGYAIALTATDVGGLLVGCQGSATFAVTAGGVTQVPVHLICHEKSSTPEPPAVPVPRAVTALLALALLALGVRRLRKSVTRSP